MGDLKGRSIRGVAVTLGAQALKFFIGLGSTMVLARLLTPKDYGVLAMVGVITGFVGVLRDGGLSIATIQRADINEAQISTLFWINAALGLVLAVIVAALSPVVAWFYNDRSLTWVTLAMAVPFVLGGLTVQHQALLQRQMRFRAMAGIEIAALVISAGVGILASAAGWGYWALATMAITFSLANAILVLLFCRWKPGPPVRGSGVRPMLKFGGVLTLSSFFDSLGGSADKLLLGKFYAAEALGIYTRAQTLMLQPLTQFMPAVQKVALPAMSRLAEKPEKLRRVFLDLLQVTAFACSFMTVYLVTSADWLVWVFLGPQWLEAADILRLLAAPALVIPLNTLCVVSLMVQSKSTALMRWGVLKNAFIVFAVFVGLLWGAKGVAAALSIVSLGILMTALNFMTAKAGPASLKEIWCAIGPGIASCALGCGVLYFVRYEFGLHNPFLGLLVLFLINCLFHALIMSSLPSGKKALASVRSLIPSFRTAPPENS